MAARDVIGAGAAWCGWPLWLSSGCCLVVTRTGPAETFQRTVIPHAVALLALAGIGMIIFATQKFVVMLAFAQT